MFKTQGRSRRAVYLVDQIKFTLSLILIVVIAKSLSDYLGSPADEIVESSVIFIAMVLYIIVDVVATVKRLHDLNKSGKHIFLLLIPIYNLIFMFVLLFEKGTTGNNSYGSDPRILPKKDYRKKLIQNFLLSALLVFLIWSVFEIKQYRNIKDIQVFIQNPKENHYLLLESDEDPDYRYFLIKITDISSDSFDVYYDNNYYTYYSDAINSVPSDGDGFIEDFIYWGTFSHDFLNEIKIVEVIDE